MNRRQVDQMILFAAVAEHGGFTAAAEALKLSKSHLSQSVRMLEQTLKVKLCYRSSRQFRLTEQGEALVEQCRKLNRLLYDTQSRLQANQAARGILRVTAPQAFGEHFLYPICQSFIDENPGIQVEVEVSNQMPDLIDRGYDLAIRITERPPENMVARQLLRFNYVCCAAPSYLRRAGTPEHPKDLSKHECLVLTGWREWTFYHGVETLPITPRGRMAFNSNALLREAALGGAGIVRVAGYLVEEDLAEGRLVRLFPQFTNEQRPIYLIYAQRTDMPAKLRLFIDHLMKRFADPER
jgi:DNA-binding transcriptional LysR family regulator